MGGPYTISQYIVNFIQHTFGDFRRFGGHFRTPICDCFPKKILISNNQNLKLTSPRERASKITVGRISPKKIILRFGTFGGRFLVKNMCIFQKRHFQRKYTNFAPFLAFPNTYDHFSSIWCDNMIIETLTIHNMNEIHIGLPDQVCDSA